MKHKQNQESSREGCYGDLQRESFSILWNGSKEVPEQEILHTLSSSSVYTFPKSIIEDYDSYPNPTLQSSMYIHNMLLVDEDHRKRKICMHCGMYEKEEGKDICVSCSHSIFTNPCYPYPYKYCSECNDFHYIIYFFNSKKNEIQSSCLNTYSKCSFKHISIINNPTIISHNPIDNTLDTPSLNQQLIDVGIINTRVRKHCSHCGNSSDISIIHSLPLCKRCCIDYTFHYKYKRIELFYKWCRKCETFHTIDYFWNEEWKQFDIHCIKPVFPRKSIHQLNKATISTENIMNDIVSQYSLVPEQLTRRFLLQSRLSYGKNLKGICCLCLQNEVNEKQDNKTGKIVRNLGIPLSGFGNHKNPSLVCNECKEIWFTFSNYPLPMKYCSRCNLFHYYFQFFNLSTHQLDSQCNHFILDQAYLEGKLTAAPSITEPSPPTLSESAACLTREAISRCRSPDCLKICKRTMYGKCIHCKRVLMDVYEEEEGNEKSIWICPFCRDHWFKNSSCSCYKWCEKCQAFHSKEYFYDQSKKYFLNTCLPSQLNPIRQRKREHDQIDYIQIPSERLSHFPSYDLMKYIQSKLTIDNPHEQYFTSLFIACIIEELWNESTYLCLFYLITKISRVNQLIYIYIFIEKRWIELFTCIFFKTIKE